MDDVDLELNLPGGFSAGDVLSLVVPGAVIAVVGFAEPASIARRYAAMDRQPWDSNRECVGQGLANLAAGFAGSFPVGGSFSRTALNRMSGARTRWSGALTGVVVLLLLPFVGLLAALAIAVLSGLVIGAVVPLVDLRTPALYWRWSKPQLVVGLVTAGATMVLAPRVERGVILGVLAALCGPPVARDAGRGPGDGRGRHPPPPPDGGALLRLGARAHAARLLDRVLGAGVDDTSA